MPLDMPPQPPAYHVERAAPAADQLSPAVRFAAAARTLADRAFAEPAPQAQRAEPAAIPEASKLLPPIDFASRALSREDRLTVARAASDLRRDELSNARSTPDSYVGDRVRLAVAYARMSEKGAADLGDGERKAWRCRMAAVAMDERAGAHVKGGERAAAAARAAVPKELLDECRTTAAVAREDARRAARNPQRVDPVLAHAEAGRARVSPEASRRAMPARLAPEQPKRTRVDLPAPRLVRLDLEASRRVSVDPTPSSRTSIDPTPSRRISISPAIHHAAGNGRGA